MMLYSRISTCSDLASSFIALEAETEKAKTIAWEALAKTMSPCETFPLEQVKMFNWAPSTLIFCKEAFNASAEPWVSAFTIKLMTVLSPSLACWAMLAKEAPSSVPFPMRACALLAAASLASFSFSNAKKRSPAIGTPEIPVTETGVEGPALLSGLLNSLTIFLTLQK